MPKTYEQLLKDQNAHTVKPRPVVAFDFSQLEEKDAEDKKDEDSLSTASGLTEGPEAIEEIDASERNIDGDIELFGNYQVVSVN